VEFGPDASLFINCGKEVEVENDDAFMKRMGRLHKKHVLGSYVEKDKKMAKGLWMEEENVECDELIVLEDRSKCELG
jgi:hypothetical protein